MRAKTSIAKRVDLEGYQGDSIIDFTFEVLNNDLTAFDFTGATDFTLTIVEKRDVTGTTLATFDSASGDLVLAGNVIIWNAPSGELDFASDEYFYNLRFVDTMYRTQTICFGEYKQIARAEFI